MRSDNSSILRFGGVTTNYASGTDWHFATITFTSKGVDGTAIFSGSIVEIADDTANDIQAANLPFVAGAGVGLVIGTGIEQRQRRFISTPLPDSVVHRSDRHHRSTSCVRYRLCVCLGMKVVRSYFRLVVCFFQECEHTDYPLKM